ncbi:Integrator complex subunit 9 [Lobosporangium transversale]|nr:Integrator complex subunit 9 [Lobosporangium transversale]
MRLTSLLPDGEPNCLMLKLRQMLILLDCGLGQEQFYAMPVREGGLTDDNKDSIQSGQPLGATTAASDSALKRKQAGSTEVSDIRQDWASFLKASSTQLLQKKRRRGSTVDASTAASSTAGAMIGTSNVDTNDPGVTSTSKSSQSSATREYMFKLPDFSGVDFKSIDVVLISNYNHILALPYLTEFTDFQGRIFATEPTIEFGRYAFVTIYDSVLFNYSDLCGAIK